MSGCFKERNRIVYWQTLWHITNSKSSFFVLVSYYFGWKNLIMQIEQTATSTFAVRCSYGFSCLSTCFLLCRDGLRSKHWMQSISGLTLYPVIRRGVFFCFKLSAFPFSLLDHMVHSNRCPSYKQFSQLVIKIQLRCAYRGWIFIFYSLLFTSLLHLASYKLAHLSDRCLSHVHHQPALIA